MEATADANVRACGEATEVPRGKPSDSVTFRFPGDLIDRLDRYAERLSAETGLPVNRTQAVILLLRRGLDVVERDPR